MSYITTTMDNLIHQTAFFNMTWGNVVMILVACVFLYLAIAKEFEPLLLVPIAFGMLLVNIYPDIMLSFEDSSNGVGGLLYYFYKLDEWAILPSLIFMGVGSRSERQYRRGSHRGRYYGEESGGNAAKTHRSGHCFRYGRKRGITGLQAVASPDKFLKSALDFLM